MKRIWTGDGGHQQTAAIADRGGIGIVGFASGTTVQGGEMLDAEGQKGRVTI